MASLIASFKVHDPDDTPRTSAPSSGIRNTCNSCRRMSSVPMYTTHSIPKRAHTVAVATPCWPAPVSAMIRLLPILLASSAWPRALFSLCDPVWLRSSRLRYTDRPARSDSLLARYSGVGRPPKSRSSPSSSALYPPPPPVPPGPPPPPRPQTPRRNLRNGARPRSRRQADPRPVHRCLLDGVEERPQLLRVLSPWARLGATRRVDRVGARERDRLGHVVHVQPAAENQRDLRPSRCEQRPVERLSRPPSQALPLRRP